MGNPPKFAPSLGPAPVGNPPTPQGILQKTSFFILLYALETSKIRRKLRNLLRPWGPCPYHLPPRNHSPNLLRPWGPCPYHLPPRHRSPWTPPRAPGKGLGASSFPLWNCHPAPTPLVYRPVHQASSGGYHPILQKTSLFFFLYALETSKIRRKLRNLLRPWARAPTTYTPGTKAPGPPFPSPCTPPHPTGYPSKKIIFFFCTRTQVAKFAPSLEPVPLPPTPPAPKPLDPPPEPQPRA